MFYLTKTGSSEIQSGRRITEWVDLEIDHIVHRVPLCDLTRPGIDKKDLQAELTSAAKAQEVVCVDILLQEFVEETKDFKKKLPDKMFASWRESILRNMDTPTVRVPCPCGNLTRRRTLKVTDGKKKGRMVFAKCESESCTFNEILGRASNRLFI